MKKTVSWALALALLVTACARTQPAQVTEPAPADYVTAGEVAAAILSSQPDGGDYAALDREDREFYVNQLYGIDQTTVAESAIYTLGGVEAGEIAVLHLFETAGGAGAAEKLEEYRQSRVGDFFGYDPAQAAIAEGGRVVTADRYVALLICADPERAETALTAALEGKPIPAPAPVETAAPAGPDPTGETAETPSPEPAPSAALVAAATPTPTPTPTPEPTSAFEIRDPNAYVPFTPPNEVDMSLYDDTPIVNAWRTGEDSGLDEKQTAILAKCREIFNEVITDGMTDFQKELALHDWLTTHGEYDRTHYDPRTPLGREDNTNPYGMLVKGYGICLGYAESFRLLMDLCEVECVTVPGAAFHSSEDHAWNMVKLEGEWYCVDCTWDNSPSHHYFNVTSEYLRQTDHQWDYENTPEATATRFRWDGTGELPT